MKYKAILLVIASDDECFENVKTFSPRMKQEWKPLFPVMKQIWESYMYENPNIKVIFVYGNSKVEKKSHDLVYSDIEENIHPGMLKKTLRAFDDIDSSYDYDFLIRTNLSTFWDLNSLEKRLNSLPTENHISGTIIDFTDKDTTHYNYIAGFDMVLSRDLIKGIINHTNDILKTNTFAKLEDLTFCNSIEKYLNVVHVNKNTNNHALFLNRDKCVGDNFFGMVQYLKDKKLDHFRVKTRDDRNCDKEILKKLLHTFYGKTIL